MATYNTGSVQRVTQVTSNGSNVPIVPAGQYVTIFQAAAAPTITRITGVVYLDSTSTVQNQFGFLATQNNQATGLIFNTTWRINGVNSPNITGDPWPNSTFRFSGGFFFFSDFVVPAGHFVQQWNSAGFALGRATWFLTVVETRLT
jgi:hypothetical protein